LREEQTAAVTVRDVVRNQWAIIVVFAIFFAAFGLIVTDYWRRGSLLLGIGVGVAAVLRLVLSDERAGLLVVRGRATDVIAMALVSAAVIRIAWTIDPLGTR
jgi:phosphate starvation-inducible membrane PsiE